LNYLLQKKVKLLSFKYNNTLLASLGVAKTAYTYCLNQYGYLDPLDSLDNAVIVHFCGSKKPWDAMALRCNENEYPYKDEAIRVWTRYYKLYSKPAVQ
jgi:lipopolysaccharide biosynthesis glycosyltransferase